MNTTLNESNCVNLSSSNIESIELVKQYESCSVYIIKTKNGMVFWNVITSIAVQFLPDKAYEICMKTVGDPDICQAVYDVSDAKPYYNSHTVNCHSNDNKTIGITKNFIEDLGKQYFNTAFNKTNNPI